VAGCCQCDDEPSGSCATELVSYVTAETLELKKMHAKLYYIQALFEI
jgi:hypothetical protein